MKKINIFSLLFALTLTGSLMTSCSITINEGDGNEEYTEYVDDGNETLTSNGSSLNTTDYEYSLHSTTTLSDITSNIYNTLLSVTEAKEYMNTNASIEGEAFVVYAYDSNYCVLSHDTTNGNWNTDFKVSKTSLENYFNSNESTVYYLTKKYKLESKYTITKVSSINNVVSNKQWLSSNAEYYVDEIYDYIVNKYINNQSDMVVFWDYDSFSSSNAYYYLQYKAPTSSIPGGWYSYSNSEANIKSTFASYTGSIYYFYSR